MTSTIVKSRKTGLKLETVSVSVWFEGILFFITLGKSIAINNSTTPFKTKKIQDMFASNIDSNQ